MTLHATNREIKPRQLRSRLEGSRIFRRPDRPQALIRAGAVGLVVGVTLFVGALFVAMPKAPPARVLGADKRIIGIPRNCDEARAAQIAPMVRGTGFYNPRLDQDGNGLACEPRRLGLL